jgi:hypothetical protein
MGGWVDGWMNHKGQNRQLLRGFCRVGWIGQAALSMNSARSAVSL